jgi:hypothetical protein
VRRRRHGVVLNQRDDWRVFWELYSLDGPLAAELLRAVRTP